MGIVSGSEIKKKIRIKSPLTRACLAEFLGTFVLCTFGCASVAMHVIPPKHNSFLSVNIAWGFGATMGLWCCAGISGGHINPAMTLASAILGRFPWRSVPFYWIAQYLGAFCGAACVYGIYHDGINHYDGGVRAVFGENQTAGIFATYPQEYLSASSALGDQVFGTMLLALCVLALTDNKNMGIPQGLAPIGVGLAITVIGMTFGANCGYPINPARDLGPRVFTAIIGYGTACFHAYNYYFWIPIVGPHIGALCGAWVYMVFIWVHIPDDTESDESFELEIDVKKDKLSAKRHEKFSADSHPRDEHTRMHLMTSSSPDA